MKHELGFECIISNLIKKLNYTLTDFADYLSVSEKTVRNYISKVSKPSLSVVDKIIDLLNVHNIDIYSLFDIEDDEYLFHGSKRGITGKITTLNNVNSSNDFGRGFYLSESFKNALTYVVNYDNSIIYRFNKDEFKNLSSYAFNKSDINDTIDWVLYIGFNRGKIISESDNNFFREYFDYRLGQYSLIIGEIADSYNFYVMDQFFDNQSDLKQVKVALTLASLGNQYVLKDETFANKLEVKDEYIIDKKLRDYLKQIKKETSYKLNTDSLNLRGNSKKDEKLLFDNLKKELKDGFVKK